MLFNTTLHCSGGIFRNLKDSSDYLDEKRSVCSIIKKRFSTIQVARNDIVLLIMHDTRKIKPIIIYDKIKYYNVTSIETNITNPMNIFILFQVAQIERDLLPS